MAEKKDKKRKRKGGRKRTTRVKAEAPTTGRRLTANDIIAQMLLSRGSGGIGATGYVGAAPTSNAAVSVDIERTKNELSRQLIDKFKPITTEITEIRNKSNQALAQQLANQADLVSEFETIKQDIQDEFTQLYRANDNLDERVKQLSAKPTRGVGRKKLPAYDPSQTSLASFGFVSNPRPPTQQLGSSSQMSELAPSTSSLTPPVQSIPIATQTDEEPEGLGMDLFDEGPSSAPVSKGTRSKKGGKGKK